VAASIIQRQTVYNANGQELANMAAITGAPTSLGNLLWSTRSMLQPVGATLLTGTSNDYIVPIGAGAYAVTLPPAAGLTGKLFLISPSTVAAITVAPSGGNTIGGVAGARTLNPNEWIVVMSDGGNDWRIMSQAVSAVSPLLFSFMWDSNVFAGPIDAANNMGTFAAVPAATYANALPNLPAAGPPVAYPIVTPMNLGPLRINVTSTAAVAGAPVLTLTLFQNGAATAVVAGTPPGIPTGQYSSAGTIAYVPGDTFEFRAAIAGGAARINVAGMLQKS
jgi:hypothetical protein